MRALRFAISLLVISMLAIALLPSVVAQTKSHPVTGAELIALVAAESLDQNIVHAIESRGIAFRPTEQYRALLTTAGADAPVMDALKSAKISADATFAEQTDSPEVLAHLAAAGKLIRAKQLEDAGKEIVAALNSRISPEAGFVMGHLQDRMQEWANSATIYSKVIQMAPDFPGTHARLAFVHYKFGDPDGAMQEAHAALEEYKDDAEAHKNMGLGLETSRNYDAAISEYREALRLKPDYSSVHCDLGLVFLDRREYSDGIAELKKAVALDPSEAVFHYDLGNALDDTGDKENAIREFRAAKRLDPSRIDARQNLANALKSVDRDAAKAEYRELIAMAPDFEMARIGLGMVYMDDADYKNAEAEYRKAAEMDASDAAAFSGIGDALARQGRSQEAIAQYHHAETLDNDFVLAHSGLGQVYLDTKDYPNAVKEFRAAVNLSPGIWDTHSLLAEALADVSDLDGAITEARESIRIAPNNPQTLVKLARYLEKKGDLAGALAQCKLAAQWSLDWAEYTNCGSIQKRLGVEVTFVRPPSGPPENQTSTPQSKVPAATANTTVATSHPTVTLKSGETVESAWQDAIHAGQDLLTAKKYAEAERTFETAVALAEKLQPFNERAMGTFDLLGTAYFMDNKVGEARATFERELDLTAKVLGPESIQNQRAISELASVALTQKDFPTVERLLLRQIDLSERNYDPSNGRIGIFLFQLGDLYQSQKEYAKAEPYMLRAYGIAKQFDGDGDPMSEGVLAKLQNLYIAWEKFDKAEPFCRKVVAIREKNYGSSSRAAAESIQTLADVLDKIGKKDEAAGLRKRSEAILGAGIPPKQP